MAPFDQIQPRLGQDLQPVAPMPLLDEDLAAEYLGQLFRRDDLLRGAVGDKSALLHEKDLGGLFGELLDVVGDHQDGRWVGRCE